MANTRPRILVIDDDIMFRNLIVSLLRKDCMVSVAKDGKEGYLKAKEHIPDVAVIDVEMPEWDGLKTLKAFRENPVLQGVRVMMLTGSADKQTVLKAIQGGANDYVIKSAFNKGDFLSKVSRMLTEPAAKARDIPEIQKPDSQQSDPTPPEPVIANATSDSEVNEIMEDWE